ncbi:hypothetical protein DL765_004367 [Monosporascus sp. GIB2]|nr:hypothetical protein DL765_004367 [Monosporascus sp. GIB2]
MRRLSNSAETPERRIVFVAQSTGGLIVKSALTMALLDDGDDRNMARHTIGIVFLATPHRGFKFMNAVRVYYPILRAMGLLSSAAWQCRQQLKPRSEYLFELSLRFNQVLKQIPIQVVSCYETVPTGSLLGLLVEKEDVIIGNATERILGLNKKHKEISKFSSEMDPDYERILDSIIFVIKSAKSAYRNSTAITEAVNEGSPSIELYFKDRVRKTLGHRRFVIAENIPYPIVLAASSPAAGALDCRVKSRAHSRTPSAHSSAHRGRQNGGTTSTVYSSSANEDHQPPSTVTRNVTQERIWGELEFRPRPSDVLTRQVEGNKPVETSTIDAAFIRAETNVVPQPSSPAQPQRIPGLPLASIASDVAKVADGSGWTPAAWIAGGALGVSTAALGTQAYNTTVARKQLDQSTRQADTAVDALRLNERVFQYNQRKDAERAQRPSSFPPGSGSGRRRRDGSRSDSDDDGGGDVDNTLLPSSAIGTKSTDFPGSSHLRLAKVARRDKRKQSTKLPTRISWPATSGATNSDLASLMALHAPQDDPRDGSLPPDESHGLQIEGASGYRNSGPVSDRWIQELPSPPKTPFGASPNTEREVLEDSAEHPKLLTSPSSDNGASIEASATNGHLPMSGTSRNEPVAVRSSDQVGSEYADQEFSHLKSTEVKLRKTEEHKDSIEMDVLCSLEDKAEEGLSPGGGMALKFESTTSKTVGCLPLQGSTPAGPSNEGMGEDPVPGEKEEQFFKPGTADVGDGASSCAEVPPEKSPSRRMDTVAEDPVAEDPV